MPLEYYNTILLAENTMNSIMNNIIRQYQHYISNSLRDLSK